MLNSGKVPISGLGCRVLVATEPGFSSQRAKLPQSPFTVETAKTYFELRLFGRWAVKEKHLIF